MLESIGESVTLDSSARQDFVLSNGGRGKWRIGRQYQAPKPVHDIDVLVTSDDQMVRSRSPGTELKALDETGDGVIRAE